MEIEQSLEKVGLTKQEAKVYLNTLKLGVAKASDIANKSNINREASYYILKQLEQKGFVSEIIKSGVKYYNAISPKRILEIIEEEKQQKTTTIKNILPDLELLTKIALTKPKIEFYEGQEGFKTVASILVQKPNQEILCYIPEKILQFIPTFHPQFRRKRKENKVRLKVISQKTETMLDLKKKDKEELREIRFNDKIIDNIDTAYYILDDAIIVLKANEKEQMGMYIKEENLAKLQKGIFNEIWAKSKPLKKQK